MDKKKPKIGLIKSPEPEERKKMSKVKVMTPPAKEAIKSIKRGKK